LLSPKEQLKGHPCQIGFGKVKIIVISPLILIAKKNQPIEGRDPLNPFKIKTSLFHNLK
jgi:hypothetical protein